MNYTDTFIAVAPDCPVNEGVVPPRRGSKTPIHVIQYELISAAPYTLTQEDVLWETHVRHKNLPSPEATADARDAFFTRPRACLRASALPKKFGWGLHFDADGKVALYAMESEEYARMLAAGRDGVKILTAMRNGRR